MRAQLVERIPSHSGAFPVWTWSCCRPDLRRGGHLEPGAAGILLEVRLPRDRVPLSAFDAWTVGPLGNAPIAFDDEEAARWEVRHPHLWSRASRDLRIQACGSRAPGRIFDLERRRQCLLGWRGRRGASQHPGHGRGIPVVAVVSLRPCSPIASGQPSPPNSVPANRGEGTGAAVRLTLVRGCRADLPNHAPPGGADVPRGSSGQGRGHPNRTFSRRACRPRSN
jgi:hypothetical protein